MIEILWQGFVGALLWLLWLLNVEVVCGILSVSAVVVSCFSPPEDRLPAMLCAILIFTGWIGFNAPMHRYGFVIWEAQLARAFPQLGLGIPFYSTERAARDIMCVAACIWMVECFMRPWLFIMGAIYLAMVGLHAYDWTLKFAGTATETAYWNTYLYPLNGLFVAQLAIIFALGAGGFRDACASWLRALCHSRGALLPAHNEGALMRRRRG